MCYASFEQMHPASSAAVAWALCHGHSDRTLPRNVLTT